MPVAFSTTVTKQGAGSLADAVAGRAAALGPIDSKCGRDCRTCDRRGACGALMPDFSKLGR